MFQHILFVAITIFWLVMSYFLWKAEHFGARVPTETVARNILSPEEDINHYDIYARGQLDDPIGSFTWTSKSLDSDGTPIGPDETSRAIHGYSVEIDGSPPRTRGSILLAGGHEVRFDLNVHFNLRHEWQRIQLRFLPGRNVGQSLSWDINITGDVTNKVVSFSVTKDETEVDPFEIKFDELGRWQSLLDISAWMVEKTIGSENQMYERLSGAVKLLTLPIKPEPVPSSGSSLGDFKLDWGARYGALPDFSPRRRVYRLEAPIHELLGNQPVIVYVDRGGEILRARIPFANIEIRNRKFYPRPTDKR